jgi:hypothetical protein
MTKNLLIENTVKTPCFDFRTNGQCTIYGNSRPEDLTGVYVEAKNFLRELIENNVPINFTFDYDYYNTNTQKYNMFILEILASAKKSRVTVVWKYFADDEDMKEMGETYISIFKNLKIEIESKLWI